MSFLAASIHLNVPALAVLGRRMGMDSKRLESATKPRRREISYAPDFRSFMPNSRSPRIVFLWQRGRALVPAQNVSSPLFHGRRNSCAHGRRAPKKRGAYTTSCGRRPQRGKASAVLHLAQREPSLLCSGLCEHRKMASCWRGREQPQINLYGFGPFHRSPLLFG